VKAVVLIPHYNHGGALGGVLEALAGHDLPCLVVDDGSDAANRGRVAELGARFPWVQVEFLPANRGRGAALRHGYRTAWRQGFSHVVQLDADGQHEAGDVPRFLAVARRYPDALVLGVPSFDATAPRRRVYGRRITTCWVAIETLSRVVPDALCGFRAVPLQPTVRLLERRPLGDGMEFDPALVVRLVWEAVPVATVPTHVRYRPGGVSHFRPWRDNARISATHARLCGGMLRRLPGLLRRRPVQLAPAEERR
jgi:glycosyltransferase involved in cell wall biosynthesis